MTKKSNDSPALAPQQFVSKPVTKWAIKFDGSHDGAQRIIDWVNAENPRFDPNDSGTWTVSGYYGTLTIRTLEGDMEAVSGDWIIKGIKGEFYPCKPDIFKDSYSPALAEPAAPSQLKILVNWLRKEADERMKAALGRRPSPEIRNMTAAQLKESKRMSEKMFGRKMDLVSTSIKENLAYCDMQDKIADKQEAEARQLNEWADLIVASAPSKGMDELRELLGKITPGPWILCHHLKSIHHDESCPCGYRGSIWGADEQRVVCEIGVHAIPGEEGMQPDRYERPVELANAQLIAMAPDLLKQVLAGAAPSSVIRVGSDDSACFEHLCQTIREQDWKGAAQYVQYVDNVAALNEGASSPSSATEQDWVNVSDKLPPLDNQWSDSGHNFAESFAKLVQTKRTYNGVPEQRVCVFNGEVWSEIGGDQITDVTHWRELPESPSSSAGTPEGK